MTSTLRIALWSGPRNVSTALMYSFAQRADTTVVDEPLYAHYLRISAADHPVRDLVLRAQDPEGRAVVRDVLLAPYPTPVVFFKSMAHHLVELDPAFLDELANVLLVRDPREMLPSLAQKLGRVPRLADTGLARQTELLDELAARGQEALVLDARETQSDPEGVLGALCARLGLAFDPAMLRWEAGPRPEDGVWGPHWYDQVHRSTGFRPWRAPAAPFPAELEHVLEEARPHHARLLRHALRARARRS